MSIFDCEPDAFTKPIKPYRTLSHTQNAKRIDAMYWRLVGKILQTAVAYIEAQLAYGSQKGALAFAEQQIADWETLHQVTPRLSVRLNDHIYPWGTRISPVRYRSMIAARKGKLLDRIEQTRSEHEDAVNGLKKRMHLIASGRAWLKVNPSRIVIETQSKADAFYELRIDDAGTKSIVVKNVSLDDSKPSELIDIVSLDADEIVVAHAAEGSGIRRRAGWVLKPVMPTSSLVGDGVRFEESFALVGKIAERGYLDAAISYHFFAAGTRPTDDYSQLAFDARIFSKHREEITRSYIDPRDRYNGIMISLRSRGVDARYAIRDRVYYGEESQSFRTRPKLESKKWETFEPLLSQFYGQSGNSKGEQRSARSCDPELWIREADEFAKALQILDGGGSFILTGAAGTGKTHMIPGFISWCLNNRKTVKVLAGGGALDVIEARCRNFMDKTYKIEVPMFWAREDDYLIFGDFDERDAFKQCRNPSLGAEILRRSKLIRPQSDVTDVLIIDEATLVPFKADQFKSVKQIIVIGDMFQIARENSVFTVAATSGLAALRLRRNFRANNCDIMTWSNIFSYNNALVVKNRGKRRSELRYVPLGRKQAGSIRAEANALAKAASNARSAGETVGIVAFNKKQVKAISDALHRVGDPQIEFLGLPEEVQGKEADMVLVSLGAALTNSGRLPTDVAGLNDDQALMKMNVALSRAREQTIVFSSILPSDIDLRLANDAQALIASVLQTFTNLPSQQQIDRDPAFNRSLN